MAHMRSFHTGATRDEKDLKPDYEGYLSPTVIQRYQEYIERATDVAWAGGLFEGEGSIIVNRVHGRIRKDGTGGERRYPYPSLKMNLTDEEIIRRFAAIVGGTVNGPHQPKSPLSKLPYWCWQTTGTQAVQIATLLYPYLGQRRQEKIFRVFGLKTSSLIVGLFSPLTIESYGRYMLTHQQTPEGLRASDNWQLGIPLDEYMKSLWRHFLDLWLWHRTENVQGPDPEDIACAIIFNASGYLHELLKTRRKTV